MAIQKVPGKMIQLDSQANSDIIFFNGVDWDRLPKGEADQILTVNEAGTLPQWSDQWFYGGGQYGYASGGWGDPGNPGFLTKIEKFNFHNTSTARYVGDLMAQKMVWGGSSSAINGYSYGGLIAPTNSGGTAINVIEKWPFASDSDGANVGDLLTVLTGNTGHSSQSYGWVSGGHTDQSGYYGLTNFTDTIQKFTFATDNNATNVGNLLTVLDLPSGCSGTDFGYTCGGQTGTPAGAGNSNVNVIQRFSFTTDGNSSDVGNLTETARACSGQSSETHGYRSGGGNNYGPGGPGSTVIDKFSFGSNSNSVDVGDLDYPCGHASGQSSLTDGYHSGGDKGLLGGAGGGQLGTGRTDTVAKFSFASDAVTGYNQLLEQHRWGLSGQQV